MSDIWLPRIIVSGLLVLAVASIAASVFSPTNQQWASQIVLAVVSGLLGYVTSAVTKQSPLPRQDALEHPVPEKGP